jgi:hypothetical protein
MAMHERGRQLGATSLIQLKDRLALMPEANTKPARLLAQGTNRAFHLLGNFDYRCLRL